MKSRSSPLLSHLTAQLNAAAIEIDFVLSEDYDKENFGNGQVLVRVGSLTLRFVRDRGQDFLELVLGGDTGESVRFDDICVAMGWRRVEDVVLRTSPALIRDELEELCRHRESLEKAVRPENLASTLVIVRQAIKARETAYLQTLENVGLVQE